MPCDCACFSDGMIPVESFGTMSIALTFAGSCLDGRDLTLVVASWVPAAEISRTFFASPRIWRPRDGYKYGFEFVFVMSPTANEP